MDSEKENFKARMDERKMRGSREDKKIPVGVLKKRAQLPSSGDKNKVDRDSGRVAELLRALDDQESEHQVEIDELEKKRTEDLTALWDEHWRRVNEIEELRSEQETYTDHLRETLREMEKENAEIREQLKGNEPLLHQISDMEEKVAVLVEGVTEKDLEIESLKADLETRIDRIRNLEEQNRQLGSELESLQDQLSFKPDNSDRLKLFEDQTKELERQNEERSMLVKTQKQLIESKDDALQDMKGRVAELEDMVERFQNVEQLQQQLLREKQEKNDNLIHLVEEQREQIKLASVRDDRSEDTGGRWERGSTASQGMQNGNIKRVAYDRPPKTPHRSASGYSSVADDAPRYYSSLHSNDDRSGYESDDRKAASIVDSRSKTPSRREWADITDGNHQPPSPYVERRSDRVADRPPPSTRKLSTTSSTLLRTANKAPLHPPSKRFETSSVASSKTTLSNAGSTLRSTTVVTSGTRQPPAASRSSTISDTPPKKWRSTKTEESSRLEQLKSQLQDARTERLRIQPRKRI